MPFVRIPADCHHPVLVQSPARRPTVSLVTRQYTELGLECTLAILDSHGTIHQMREFSSEPRSKTPIVQVAQVMLKGWIKIQSLTIGARRADKYAIRGQRPVER